MTPEAAVKAKVKKILESMSIYYFFPAANGMGRAGIPDVICCMDGHFIGIECKAGKGKVTALQERELTRIAEAGGTALLINELSVLQLQERLNVIRSRASNY